MNPFPSLIALAVLAAAALGGLGFLSPEPLKAPLDRQVQQLEDPQWGAPVAISAPQGTISAGIASTSALRERGLSGHAPLEPGRGLLFVFQQPGVYGFWMKDMLFPIDIVWIDASRTVIGLAERAEPASFPATFIPPAPVSFVLEIGAGEAARLGIATGTPLMWQ